MNDVAIHVDHAWKKFRKGELHDSLRDLIPAVARRLVGRGPRRGELADREFWALRDVTFEVKRGESLGIIGPNGAGKSTMLKLLSRIIKPNRGSYRVNGRLSALIEVGAGFHQDLTGRENIYLNGTILGMRRAEIKAKEEQIIDFADVEEFIDTPVKRYSSGMKARLGFAVAAHVEPDVLLVDEVLSVGDVKFRSKCLNHMMRLIKGDVTVIFVTHLLEQVRSLCPNTLVLDRGQNIYLGPTDGAIRAYFDALENSTSNSRAAETAEAELHNVRLCDSEGHDVLQWTSGAPAGVEFDLIIKRPLSAPRVQVNLHHNYGGAYLGTADSFLQGTTLPTEVGRYTIRFTLDPMPLADGEYSLEIKILDGRIAPRFVGEAYQPIPLSVRGSKSYGGVIRCEGHWEVCAEPQMTGQVWGQP